MWPSIQRKSIILQMQLMISAYCEETDSLVIIGLVIWDFITSWADVRFLMNKLTSNDD